MIVNRVCVPLAQVILNVDAIDITSEEARQNKQPMKFEEFGQFTEKLVKVVAIVDDLCKVQML